MSTRITPVEQGARHRLTINGVDVTVTRRDLYLAKALIKNYLDNLDDGTN